MDVTYQKSDPPLSENGKQQAYKLGESMRKYIKNRNVCWYESCVQRVS